MQRYIARCGDAYIFLTAEGQYALTVEESAVTEQNLGTAIVYREPHNPVGLSPIPWAPHGSAVHTPNTQAPWRRVGTAIRWIHRTHAELQQRGFSGLMAFLDSMAQKVSSTRHALKNSELLEAHIRARVWYPKRIECLIGSAALAAHAWNKGLPYSFVVGVQHPPFAAHAWVEHENIVINDIPDNRDHLAEVVRIP